MEIRTFTRVSNKQEKAEKIIRPPEKGDIIPSIMLFLLSRAPVVGMFPFSVSMFGAIYDKKAAYLGIAAMLLGLLSKGAGFECVKYIFSGVIFWLYTRLRPNEENKLLSAGVCGASLLVCGGILLPYTNPTIYGMMLLIVESMLSAFMYIVFTKTNVLLQGRGNRTQIAQEELISLTICTGGVIMGFSGINLPTGISISHLLTMYAVMIVSMHGSLGMSCVGGLVLGMVSGMNADNAVMCMGYYGLCGIFSNMLKNFGKAGVGLGFLGGSAVALLYVGNTFAFPAKIIEVIISVGAYMLTPKKAHYMIGAFLSRSFHMEVIRADIRVKEYLSTQLGKIAASFSKLEESFFAVSEKRLRLQTGEVADMFDSVADKVCESCGMCRQCWQKEFNDTYRQMFSILDTIEKKGRCDAGNAPPLFRDKCVRLDSFLIEFTHMYEIYKQKAVWVGEAVAGRDLVAKQYHEISNIMENLLEKVDEGFSFLEDMENKVIEEFDKIELPVREVSIIETGHGRIEAYLSVGFTTDLDTVCRELSTILDTPMELSEIKDGICHFVSKCAYSVEIATSQMSKGGQAVCGDSVLHFKTDDDKYCILMCDGMGSGADASKESELTSNLFKEFLNAGFQHEMAAQLINSALALKMDRECFSTIDLLVIDLMTGIGEFMKIGGAESYIRHNGDTEVIFSKTFPAGMLGDIATDSITRVFKGGEIIVMATDGVTESGNGIIRGEWIKRVMLEENDVDTLAEKIIEGALKKSGGEVKDDMSVAAVKVVRCEV